jgi:predicted acyl esterase
MKEFKNIAIPMRDGIRLMANIRWTMNTGNTNDPTYRKS